MADVKHGYGIFICIQKYQWVEFLDCVITHWFSMWFIHKSNNFSITIFPSQFFHHNSNLMENLFQYKYILGYHIAMKFCTWHDSTAVMSCALISEQSLHFNLDESGIKLPMIVYHNEKIVYEMGTCFICLSLWCFMMYFHDLSRRQFHWSRSLWGCRQNWGICNLYASLGKLEIVDQWPTRIPLPPRRGWHCSKSQGSHFESDIANNH